MQVCVSSSVVVVASSARNRIQVQIHEIWQRFKNPRSNIQIPQVCPKILSQSLGKMITRVSPLSFSVTQMSLVANVSLIKAHLLNTVDNSSFKFKKKKNV